MLGGQSRNIIVSVATYLAKLRVVIRIVEITLEVRADQDQGVSKSGVLQQECRVDGVREHHWVSRENIGYVLLQQSKGRSGSSGQLPHTITHVVVVTNVVGVPASSQRSA